MVEVPQLGDIVVLKSDKGIDSPIKMTICEIKGEDVFCIWRVEGASEFKGQKFPKAALEKYDR